MKLIGWMSRAREKENRQMYLRLKAEQLREKKKKKRNKTSRVSHVTWEANSDELGNFASYFSISGGLDDG